MNDDEIVQSLLDKLDEFDKQARGAALFATEYATNYLGVEDERKAHRLVSLLESEGLVDHIRYSEWNLTDKGRAVMEKGGWPIYKKLIDERERKAARDARLVEMKMWGEAMQFRFWWLTLALGLIGAGGTVYQLINNDAPTRAEYNQLMRNVDTLQKSRNVPAPKPAVPTKSTALSTN